MPLILLRENKVVRHGFWKMEVKAGYLLFVISSKEKLILFRSSSVLLQLLKKSQKKSQSCMNVSSELNSSFFFMRLTTSQLFSEMILFRSWKEFNSQQSLFSLLPKLNKTFSKPFLLTPKKWINCQQKLKHSLSQYCQN